MAEGSSRDTCVFLAKLAEQAERYDEMVSCELIGGRARGAAVCGAPPAPRRPAPPLPAAVPARLGPPPRPWEAWV